MIEVKILDETAPLEAVVLGTAQSLGGVPMLEETYDPKSKEHILNGTFPVEEDLVSELNEVAAILKKHHVKVFRPEIIPNYNQIFARDIALVIEDKMIIPCVTQLRKLESDGIKYIEDDVKHALLPDCDIRMEGGDVIVWKGNLFVGYSTDEDFQSHTVARTNVLALEYLKKEFTNWNVRGFELNKSDDDPYENALHLDCCFQPVGDHHAVIYPGGFKNEEDLSFLKSFFGEENVFEITREEMYEMNANFFSISPTVVISDSSFKRLNNQLRRWGLTVEEVTYREVAKMEGLLRCTTLPLRRRYV